jgi:hypothetical protein
MLRKMAGEDIIHRVSLVGGWYYAMLLYVLLNYTKNRS